MANQRVKNLLPQVIPIELTGETGPQLYLLKGYEQIVIDPSRASQDLTDKANAVLGISGGLASSVSHGGDRLINLTTTNDPTTSGFGPLG